MTRWFYGRLPWAGIPDGPCISVYTPWGSAGLPPNRSRGIKGQWGISGRFRGRVFYLLRAAI